MVNEVSLSELEQAIKSGAFVADVREDWEFEAGHVPSARHIPLGALPDVIKSLPQEGKIWVICQAGGRSMKAAEYLDQLGFDAVSVAGGTGSWIASGRQVVLGLEN